MIRKIAIAGYRSLRDVKLGLGALNVVTGANGSGKSSLYRAVRLLADIAQGRIIQSLAAEGGLHSTLWAGPEAFSRAMKNGPATGPRHRSQSLDDPATGSANVALVGLLASLRPERDVSLQLRIAQGVDMGRPSLLEAAAEKRDGKLTAASIGGRCVTMMRGTLEL